MDHVTSLLVLACAGTVSMEDAREVLPYSRNTLYRAASVLKRSGTIRTQRRGGTSYISLTDNAVSTGVPFIVHESLARGVDPSKLLKAASSGLPRLLQSPRTLTELSVLSGIPYARCRRALDILIGSGTVKVLRRRPLKVVMDHDDPLARALTGARQGGPIHTLQVRGDPPVVHEIYRKGEAPMVLTSSGPVAYPGSDLIMVGRGTLRTVHVLDDVSSLEAVFLCLLGTYDGAVHVCPAMIDEGSIDIDRLVTLSHEKGVSSSVGCFLDLMNSIRNRVPPSIVERFAEKGNGRGSMPLGSSAGRGPLRSVLERKWDVSINISGSDRLLIAGRVFTL